MKENNEKILIFYYDKKSTSPEELQEAASLMNRFSKTKTLFLPKNWDYEYLTKEETISQLKKMIEFVQEG